MRQYTLYSKQIKLLCNCHISRFTQHYKALSYMNNKSHALQGIISTSGDQSGFVGHKCVLKFPRLNVLKKFNSFEKRTLHSSIARHEFPNPYDAEFIQFNTEISTEHLTPEIKLHLITPNCPLWKSRGDECPVPDPFWAFYWPGGQALSR